MIPGIRKCLGKFGRESPVVSFLAHPLVRFPAHVAAAGYLAAMGLQHDHGWVKNFPSLHSWMIWIVISLQAACTLASELRSWLKQRVEPFEDQDYGDILGSFLYSLGRVVDAKRRRFQNRLAKIDGRKNIFDAITHPKEQVEEIVTEAVNFLRPLTNLENGRFSVTVIFEIRPNHWDYIAKSDGTHNSTHPNSLMKDRQSAAVHAIELGQTVFHADKVEAQGKEKYTPSPRDKELGKRGSIYVIPKSATDINGVLRHCLISFSTYGVPLCEPGKEHQAAAFRLFFEEYAARIHLEFILFLIQNTRKKDK